MLHWKSNRPPFFGCSLVVDMNFTMFQGFGVINYHPKGILAFLFKNGGVEMSRVGFKEGIRTPYVQNTPNL